MKMNINALKSLEFKLAEYSKANGAIAEHESANTNCSSGCIGHCTGTCDTKCTGTCGHACSGIAHRGNGRTLT